MKYSVYIVEEMMLKESIKECPNMRQNSDETKKYRQNRDDLYTTQGFETDNRSYLRKIDNLIICKEGENEETPPYEVVALSVMFILSDKPWFIQAMKIWLLRPKQCTILQLDAWSFYHP